MRLKTVWCRMIGMAGVMTVAFGRVSRSQLRMTQEEMLGSNVVRVLDPDSTLRRFAPVIRATIDSMLRRVAGLLPLTAVTISIAPDARRTIPGYGVGGYTPNANSLEIYIDPAFPDLDRLLPARLAQTFAHEAHHAVRQRGPGYGQTLLEALVTEGLADRFAAEVLQLPANRWNNAFPLEETRAVMDLARPELDSRRYDYQRWFGSGGGGLPPSTGYTLGWRLVAAYLDHNPGQNATTLVYAPAREFRGALR
jgi:hypothetical protein